MDVEMAHGVVGSLRTSGLEELPAHGASASRTDELDAEDSLLEPYNSAHGADFEDLPSLDVVADLAESEARSQDPLNDRLEALGIAKNEPS